MQTCPPSSRPLACIFLLLQWGATVYAHRKACDDHVKVAAVGRDGRPAAADITDDRLAIRIPNAPGGCSMGWVGARRAGWVSCRQSYVSTVGAGRAPRCG